MMVLRAAIKQLRVFNRFRLALALWLSFTINPAIGYGSNEQVLPVGVDFTYEVMRNGRVLGDYIVSLSFDGEFYRAASITKASPLIALLAGSVEEQSIFRLRENRMWPISYEEKRSGVKSYRRTAEFDWENMQVIFSESGQQPLTKTATVDSGSLIYAFMLPGWNPLESQLLHVVSGLEIRQYGLMRTSDEEIATPIGELRTFRIDLQRIDKPGRLISLWLDLDNKNLPVKISKQRGDKNTTFLISAISEKF